jgi:hypothetical protein
VAKPIVVTVIHALEKDEAERRILDGLARAQETLPSVVTVGEIKSEPGRITLSAEALAQSMTATILVQDEQVTLETSLPLLLTPFTAKVTNASERWFTKLLSAPAAVAQ